jgi:hypothetical protein
MLYRMPWMVILDKALLLFKHIRDPDLQQKLPDILALLKNLGEKRNRAAMAGGFYTLPGIGP